MALMDVFKKRKNEVALPIPSGPAPGPAAFSQRPPTFKEESSLPADLEQFRMQPVEPVQPTFPTSSYSQPEPIPAPVSADKLDLVLSKLETIDARLRVIEEKLERRSNTHTSMF